MHEQQISPLLESRLDPLLGLIGGRNVAEICANGPGMVFADIIGRGWQEIRTPWLTEEWARDTCAFLANEMELPFTDEKPVLAVQLPGGHRTNWGLGANFHSHENTRLALTVRVKRPFNATFQDFGLSDDHPWALQLREAMENGKAILVSGGTNSGKTTLLNMLCQFIPHDKRLVVTEDVPELTPPHRNFSRILVSRLVGKSGLTHADAINQLTRMTPEVAGVGEISVDNAFAYLRIANTGHESSFATIHANSPWGSMRAMRKNVAMSGNDPFGVIEEMVETIDLIVQVKSVRDGVRRVRKITDVVAPRDLPEVMNEIHSGARV